MDSATIAAIATPAGRGGIGIIKISGGNALPVSASVFCRNINKKSRCSNYLSFKSHQFYHGFVVDYSKNQIIDEVLFVYMKTPRTYTMEDVVEIHAHANSVILKKILSMIIDNGARLAEPGEFTKRAFLNGRIDLTQAEAVINIINAKSTSAMKIAANQISGELKKKIKNIIEKLKVVATDVESLIDFRDEQEKGLDVESTKKYILDNIFDPIENLIKNYDNSHCLRDGVNIIIAGKPNVGKSTLMNRLVEKERSIVTSFPGTTRDVIEDMICFDGIPLIIKDSAGIHASNDPVEIIGIQKTLENIEQADIVFFVLDGSEKPDKTDHDIFNKIKQKQLVLVINKIDLIDESVDMELPYEWKRFPVVQISARYDKGINRLRDMISKIVLGDDIIINDLIVPTLRQKQCLERGKKKIIAAIENITAEAPLEIVSIDIGDAIGLIGQIIGETGHFDLLDSVFSRFCVGK